MQSRAKRTLEQQQQQRKSENDSLNSQHFRNLQLAAYIFFPPFFRKNR